MQETVTDLEKLKPTSEELFDIVVIGAGPAGMSAAVCASRADLKVLVIEKAMPGGECSTAWKIDNYIGFPNGILGEDLGKKMEKQLLSHDIAYSCDTVADITDIKESTKVIHTGLGYQYKTKSIILAMGLEPKELNASFESQFLGRGISYYAQCDAEHYKGKEVMVIGGGNCACYAADYLSKYAQKVYLVHQFDHIRAVKTLERSILENPLIDIIWDSKVEEVFGIDSVEKAKVVNISNNQHVWLDVKGIFIYVGRIPSQDLLSLELDLDENGFIIADEYMRTNIPGVYAAGDIRNKQIRQIATAVSDGMTAAINVERDLFR